MNCRERSRHHALKIPVKQLRHLIRLNCRISTNRGVGKLVRLSRIGVRLEPAKGWCDVFFNRLVIHEERKRC